jgi:tetratricopeptide (TPR) repeat protein
MNVRHQRAALLVRQDRHAAAVRELQQAILEEEDNPYHHGLLAIALSRLDQHQQALEAAARAIALTPDSAYGHYVRAIVFLDRDRYREAREELLRAHELEADDVDTLGLLAKAEFGLDHWRAALDAANKGLAIDATDDTCLHWRSLALARLGRKAEAEETLSTLMAADPNDPYTHETHGWFALERGDASAARRHFLESLRLAPHNEGARAGLAAALKARHRLFGLVLQFLLQLHRFRAWVIWLFLLEMFLGLRMANDLTVAYPDWSVPLLLVEAVFFSLLALVCVAQPLFDLVLRLDREGRRALTPALERASNGSVACLLAALALGVLWAREGDLLFAMLAWAAMSLPFAIRHTCTASAGWVRNWMKLVTLIAVLLIPASFILVFLPMKMAARFGVTEGLWLIPPQFIFLPLASVLLAWFSDRIHHFLEQRKPDNARA